MVPGCRHIDKPWFRDLPHMTVQTPRKGKEALGRAVEKVGGRVGG